MDVHFDNTFELKMPYKLSKLIKCLMLQFMLLWFFFLALFFVICDQFETVDHTIDFKNIQNEYRFFFHRKKNTNTHNRREVELCDGLISIYFNVNGE